MAETYHNLGMVYRQLGDYDEAEKAVTQAVRHAEAVGEPALMALTSGGRAELRIDRGDAELALSELDRAVRLADVAGDVIGRAELGASAGGPSCVRAATTPRWSTPRPDGGRRTSTAPSCSRPSAPRSRRWPIGRWDGRSWRRSVGPRRSSCSGL
jgi:tetratricopeptide (TPR) repeat protein